MDLFDGLSYTQADMFLAEALQDQGNSYWSMMHANPYKYGFSGSIGNSYYNFSQLYDFNEYALRLDGGRRLWDTSVPSTSVELPQLVPDGPGEAEASNTSYTNERIRTSSSTSSPQELLDLGEAVGTQSRGLSQEHISSLPVKKYKCSFFSRKKKRKESLRSYANIFTSFNLFYLGDHPAIGYTDIEMLLSFVRCPHSLCVICQMEYKRGERQMTLPCQHVYHSGCVSRWLTLNKACPVCAAEVPSDKR
ncbi:E3 ubiquitin ligase BIG BROTHER [Platanthera guangdongensis]|uniref:E3 ubiquitin ligase BIG BROTHER n=1 Tax=Platanthera guangdongensis TaxID=2320717 RepID=A0ABR2LLV7_9ASPA